VVLTSSVKQLTSGVVQGSCLGPLLFVLYINDVSRLFDNICIGKLYADDVKCYTVINVSEDIYRLQEYLDKLADWSRTWQLTISSKSVQYCK
jgi:ribonuclease P/MRP protein subunit RPP40